LAVKLRLTRMGRKKRPYYRIVAVDSRQRRDGGYIEAVGNYNPITKPAGIEVDRALALKWLGHGAQPTDTVRSLLSKSGVMLAFDLSKRGASAEDIDRAVAEHVGQRAEKAGAAAEAQRKAAEAAARAKAKADAEAAEAQAKAEAEAKAAAEAPVAGEAPAAAEGEAEPAGE
jgi:small subunit ribosomal protein S16